MKTLIKQTEQVRLTPEWLNKIESVAAKYSKVGDSVFFAPDHFPWVEDLEADWQAIRQELDRA